jgi:endoglycosylceramidase
MRSHLGPLPLLALLACADPQDSGDTAAVDPLSLRPLAVDDHRIVDDLGRDVLLRGANVTSLGEYWQGNPGWDPTLPTTEADWAAMEARGLNVIRLVVNWSRIEPERGSIDQAYLGEVEAYVDAAAAHGIRSVIDMHQDAYSAFIYTPEGEDCPEGSRPGKGWDGAPAWASITDGLSACVTGDRNSAPAVVAAWNHFYDNDDGIRDRFVASWTAVAQRFAQHPAVAGYDLLNEPDTSRPASELTPIYEALLAELISAIRATGSEQLIFLEPAIPAGDGDNGIIFPDPGRMGVEAFNLVGSTHNYAESIDTTGLSLEATNDLLWTLAEQQDTAVWIGEYGFWSTSEGVLEVAARYAADADAHAQGGAWWQWRQPCGDPHSLTLNDEGGWEPGSPQTHLNTMDCESGEDLGPTEPFLQLLGRGYPQATPGRITSLLSDPETGALRLEAEAEEAGGVLVLWTPTTAETHAINVQGLDSVEERSQGEGRLITATVGIAGPYSMEIGAP